jgi:mRNA interferase MazF
MKQGEIWLVNFSPSFGHEFRKERPALIIESDSEIKKSSVATVMPLTSNLGNKVNNDFLIQKNNKNKLFKDSVLKVSYIKSFDKKRFKKRLGEIKKTTLKKVQKYISKHFDL